MMQGQQNIRFNSGLSEGLNAKDYFIQRTPQNISAFRKTKLQLLFIQRTSFIGIFY